jgi:hypothetical protein
MSIDATADSRWSDAYLDQMRAVGDPPADEVIARLFSSRGFDAARELLATLISNRQSVPAELPADLKAYLDTTTRVAALEPQAVQTGQLVFAKYGPEILLLFAFYSLPASYAARKGVQVLYRTGYLNHRPNHRVFETAQMVIDIFTPGGLDPLGRGVRSAQKVRLMHAAIRFLLRHDPQNPWPAELGTPINQEDLAGTLMVFVPLVIEGLIRMGLDVTAQEQQAYLDTWSVVARIMGVRDELIPTDPHGAALLCGRIQQRQIEICPEGKAMVDALLETMSRKFPTGHSRRWPAALMRHFLPVKVADGFALPSYPVMEFRLNLRAALTRWTFPVLERFDQRPWRRFLMKVVDSVILQELHDRRPDFKLPSSLHASWQRVGG